MTDYKQEARKFLKEFSPALENYNGSLTYMWQKVKEYNKGRTKINQIVCRNGATRIALIGKDFVVKMDYDADDDIKMFGGCGKEYALYRKCVRENSPYLHCLLEIAKIKVGNHFYYIMPKANYCGHTSFLNFNCEERNWLYSHVNDLHNGNIGKYNGKPVVIDYACQF